MTQLPTNDRESLNTGRQDLPNNNAVPDTAAQLHTPEQLTAMLKAAREEAAAYRIKAREKEEFRKQAEAEKMAVIEAMHQKEEYKKLYEQKNREIQIMENQLNEAKKSVEILNVQREERHKTLLAHFAPEQQKQFKDFTLEQLETVFTAFRAPQQSQGTERTTGQQTRQTVPSMPFTVQNADAIHALAHVFGG